MKSLKRSRIDRLLRRRLREQKEAVAEKKLTESQKIKRYNKLIKIAKKRAYQEGRNRCAHGIAFSEYECFACNADAIATRLRDEWSPRETYKALVYINDEEQSAVPLEIKTRGLTRKITEMQQNGFWYVKEGCPIYMTPGKIKVVVLEERLQNPLNIDQDETPGPVASGRSVSAQR